MNINLEKSKMIVEEFKSCNDQMDITKVLDKFCDEIKYYEDANQPMI